MTRCSYVEPRLRALLDGELAPGENQRVLQHLDRCPSCREAFARVQEVSVLLQELPEEDVPPHFEPNLQLRLSRLRRERAEAEASRRRFRLPKLLPAWRLTGAVGTLALAGVLLLFTFIRGASASEIARKAELSWDRIQNYGCEFVSRGVYQGQEREFKQTQFYRKPGFFRLDTTQDYPLTTYVYTDRVIHFIPRGDWKGVGPLVVVRPRIEGQDALPFPFGVTWQNGGNVSLDGLIRQLARNEHAEVKGVEKVGERDCYRLAFTGGTFGGRTDQYELWIDRETFLPRRVSWYRDEQNHIITEAEYLQVNGVLPKDTFDFQVPAGASVVNGDVDPHLLTMPFVPKRGVAHATAPVLLARTEINQRSSAVRFPLLAPEWLPEGFELVRVRRRVGRWVDAHWIRSADNGLQIIKFVQQDLGTELSSEIRRGEAVNLGTAERPIPARLLRRDTPYPSLYLSWEQNGTRFLLFAADLPERDLLRIARSLTPADKPSIAAIQSEPVLGASRDASALPEVVGEPSDVQDVTTVTLPETDATPSHPQDDAPMMMPEISDEDTR